MVALIVGVVGEEGLFERLLLVKKVT